MSSPCPSPRSTPTSRPDWTMTFDDLPRYGALEAAQLAGVKRLLKDNGYKIGAIDAQARQGDRRGADRFSQANAFRRPATATTNCSRPWKPRPQSKAARPSGYTVCNDDKADVHGGDGAKPAGTDFVTRGWWHIAGGACARMITTPLKAIGGLAAGAKAGRRRDRVSGPDQFCVSRSGIRDQGPRAIACRAVLPRPDLPHTRPMA